MVLKKEEPQDPSVAFRYPRVVTYKHSLGYQSKFAHALKMGRIIATKCPVDGRCTVPPRIVCLTWCMGQTMRGGTVQRPSTGHLVAMILPIFNAWANLL